MSESSSNKYSANDTSAVKADKLYQTGQFFYKPVLASNNNAVGADSSYSISSASNSKPQTSKIKKSKKKIFDEIASTHSDVKKNIIQEINIDYSVNPRQDSEQQKKVSNIIQNCINNLNSFQLEPEQLDSLANYNTVSYTSQEQAVAGTDEKK